MSPFSWPRNSRLARQAAAKIKGTVLTLAPALRSIRNRPFLAYPLAFLLIELASLLQWQLKDAYAGAPFLTIYPAIILATLGGGAGPGFISAILAGASQFLFFIPYFHWIAFNSYTLDAVVCVSLTVLINGTIETLWTSDALTGLANRVLFNEQLERMLRQTLDGDRIAVLYLGLDNMKLINETYGHAVGDKLILGVANRLRGCVKDSDSVARLNGDEFAIMQTKVESTSEAAELAERIGAAIREPFRIEGNELIVNGSIGISIAPDDAADLHNLLRAADIALSEAKTVKGGAYRFYRPAMNVDVQRRGTLERELRQAVLRDELELQYQPIVNVNDGRIRSFEALLRWRHPELGSVSPSEFVPIAEETALIVPIGEWVLRTACAAGASWGRDINVAVNISVVQLASKSLIGAIEDALKSAALPPNRLIIEITESVMLENTSINVAILKKISELGVQLSMDDFGAGYSSLTHLLSVPFSKIKIDQRFIAGLPDRPESRAVVRAIADMARELNIRVVAEGVEQVEQLEELRRLGCTDIQGYLISIPLPASQVREFCRAHGVDIIDAKDRVA